MKTKSSAFWYFRATYFIKLPKDISNINTVPEILFAAAWGRTHQGIKFLSFTYWLLLHLLHTILFRTFCRHEIVTSNFRHMCLLCKEKGEWVKWLTGFDSLSPLCFNLQDGVKVVKRVAIALKSNFKSELNKMMYHMYMKMYCYVFPYKSNTKYYSTA